MRNLVTLLYHDVYAAHADESGFGGAAADRYKLPLEEFEAQLAELAETIVYPPVLVNEVGAETRLLPPLAITVDDGGISFHSHVAARLEAHGWRGHCFVTTGCIGRPGFLHKHHLRDLHARGHLIGSHSVTHPRRFAACTPEIMLREWSDSRHALQDILGADVTAASVPGGHFSATVARAAAAAGLDALFTSEPETRVHAIGGCRVFGRYTVRPGCRHDLPARLAHGDAALRQREWLAWNGKKALKTVLGAGYPLLADWAAQHGRGGNTLGGNPS